MKNINKIRLPLLIIGGLFLLLSSAQTVSAAAPTATNLSAPETYTENTPKNLTDIVTGDTDGDLLTVTLTLSNPQAGILNTGTAGGDTSTYTASSGVWTVRSSAANVNTLLASLTFTPYLGFNSAFTVSTSVSDGVTPPLTGAKAFTGVASVGGPSLSAFITTWQTNNSGASGSNQITFPAFADANYDIDWGDGNTSTNVIGPATHTYATAGAYTVMVTGAGFNGMGFGLSGDYLKLIYVHQWGTATWDSMSGSFFGAGNMSITAIDSPDLSQVTDFIYTFRGTTFTSGLEDWDVSNVNSFVGMFQDAAFNGDISNWDMSSAANTAAMFYNAPNFNQDIGDWNMGSVTNMNAMFYHALAFNQDISGWDVIDVTDMAGMFDTATSFNQNLGAWDIGNVTAFEEFLNGVTLSTANYDGMWTGWFAHGFPQEELTFDGGNSTYCAIEAYQYFQTVPTLWDITDGGYGTCPLVLTEVTPIPTTITSGDQAVYHFSVNSQVDTAWQRHFGEYSLGVPGCASCVATIDPDAHTVTFTGLKKTDTIDFTFSFVIDDEIGVGESNELRVGPFSFDRTRSGSLSANNREPKEVAHQPGSLILSSERTVWFITSENVRRPFTSAGALLSYGFAFSEIQQANAADLALQAGTFISPRDGSIFCASETKDSDVKGECALITNGKKASFVSQVVFKGLGFSFKNAFYGDSSFLTKTDNISSTTEAHRPGVLINNSGTVQLVGNDGMLGIPSFDVLNSWRYSSNTIVPANAADKLKSQTGVMTVRVAGQLNP